MTHVLRALPVVVLLGACGSHAGPADGGALDLASSLTGDAGGAQNARARLLADYRPAYLHAHFCLGAGTTWIGPALAGDYAGPGSGGFESVSPYALFPPGSYSLRLVSSTSDTCDPIVGIADVPLSAPLAAGGAYTIAVTGDFGADASRVPAALVFEDDVVADGAPGQLRVVNLAERTGTLEVARINVNTPAGPAHDPVPLFVDVAYGAVGQAPATGGATPAGDANGYVSLPPGDMYFYYDLPIYPQGGDVTAPTISFHETDGFLLNGAWTIFFVNHQDTGALAYALCLDDGSTTSSKCSLR